MHNLKRLVFLSFKLKVMLHNQKRRISYNILRIFFRLAFHKLGYVDSSPHINTVILKQQTTHLSLYHILLGFHVKALVAGEGGTAEVTTVTRH